MAGNGLHGILGTGWSISAGGREKGRNEVLISSNKQKKQAGEQRAHPSGLSDSRHHPFLTVNAHQPLCPNFCIRPVTAARMSAGERKEKPGRTARTISLFTGKLSRCSLKASRIIRLILFRSTALPVFFCTLIPNRLCSIVLAAKIRENPFPCSLLPWRYTRLNSPFFLNRHVLGSLNRSITIRRTTASVLWRGDA